MAGRLTCKRAFVTGAGQGIGRAVALAFAWEGAEVVAASRTFSKMQDLPVHAAAIRPVELDVTDGPAVGRAIGEAGRIDILFNCAGWVQNGTILECSDEDWARALDQNVTSCFHTIRAALPQMLAQGSGAIINVASVASSITGVENRAAYGASKAAVIGLTKAVARDVIRSGVRVNALCPGTTHSPSLEDRIQATKDPEATRREFMSRQAVGAFLYLASEALSGYVTGQNLEVNGGQYMP